MAMLNNQMVLYIYITIYWLFISISAMYRNKLEYHEGLLYMLYVYIFQDQLLLFIHNNIPQDKHIRLHTCVRICTHGSRLQMLITT